MMRRVRLAAAFLPLLAAAGTVGAAHTGGEAERVMEFRYRAPEAGEVFLVWGIRGWQAVPGEERPPGTVVVDRVMRTPMENGGGVFRAAIRVRAGEPVDYGFLVTATRDGLPLEVAPLWDGRPEYIVPAGEAPAVIEAEIPRPLFPRAGAATVLYGLAVLLAAVGAAYLLDAALRGAPPEARRRAAFFAMIAIVGFGLYLRASAAAAHNPAGFGRLSGDEPDFYGKAMVLLDGRGFESPGRVPLYPAWLAAVHRLTGGSYRAILYCQAVLGLATIVLTYFLGKAVFGTGAGLMAAAWASGSRVLVNQSLGLLSEVLYTPFLLLSALALVHAYREPAPARSAAAGALVGAANLVRPAMVFFPFFLGALLPFAGGIKGRARNWACFCLVSIAVVSPWVVRNYLRFDAVIPLQTSRGILWQASPEYYRLTHGGGYTYLRVWREILYGPGWERNDPESVEGDRYWNRRGLRSIAAEPLTYLKYAVEKAATYWVGDPGADWGNRGVFSYVGLRQVGWSSRAAVEVLLARLLPVVVLAGALFSRAVREKGAPLLALMGYFTLLHALTHAEARLSEPLQPLLLVVAAGMLAAAFDRAGVPTRAGD
jgi:4-amino-4-deoxy-L-arabinose transferase-like glycosyltransferase